MATLPNYLQHEVRCIMMASVRFPALLVVLIGGLGMPAWAAPYYPTGPQLNVPVATVLAGGWTACYTASIGSPFGIDAAATLANCPGSQLLVAGHQRGSDTYAVLAAAPKADALTDTGANTSNTHTVNGSQWYNSDLWAFGFAPEDGAVTLSSCDITEGEDRLCVHTFSAVGGFRVGSAMNLNSDTNWEIVVYSSDNTAP
jgi:hypothetical protein